MEEYRFTPRQRFWTLAGFVVGFLIVGGSAFASSYTHIRDISLIKHQSSFVANMMPWSVDGMLGIAAIAMYIDARTGRYPRGWARFAFWFGLAASMAANVGSFVVVWGIDLAGMIVAAAPPAFFMISVEIVSKPGKLREVVDKVERLVGLVRAATDNHTAPQLSTPDGQRPEAPVSPAIAHGEATRPATGALVRQRRLMDDGPLPQQLVELALRIGAQWRERTGREITRVQLRDQIKSAGGPGISNVTAGRLLDLIRNATTGDGDRAEAGTPDQAEAHDLAGTAAANGR